MLSEQFTTLDKGKNRDFVGMNYIRLVDLLVRKLPSYSFITAMLLICRSLIIKWVEGSWSAIILTRI